MKKLWLLPLIIVLTVACGRLAAWKAASDYGRKVRTSATLVGVAGFADTANLRQFLASPEVAGPKNRIHSLAFLGGGYDDASEDLEKGVIYLSEQMSMPVERRFSSPPVLKRLTLISSDKSNEGIGNALIGLLDSYDSKT